MKLKIEGGELRIDVRELVDALGPKERKDIARFVAADEQLWKAILECVSDTSKYAGSYYGDDDDGAWWFDHRIVMELREKLIPLMPEIARLAVEEALRQRNQAKEDERRVNKWAWEMYHAWPDGYQRSRPHGPGGWQRGDENVEAEAAKLIEGRR